MNPLILLKDITQLNAFVKSIAETNARISFTAADVSNEVVKELQISLVTIEGTRPKCIFFQPELGVQILIGFSTVAETGLSDQFTLQSGEFVSKDFAYIIPEGAVTLYVMCKSLPSDTATSGLLNLAFHGGW